MNRYQRHMLVVAMGAVSIVVGLAANRVWNDTPADGWFMYAPGSDAPFEPSSDAGMALRRVAVWIVVIAVWAALAFRIYRSSDES